MPAGEVALGLFNILDFVDVPACFTGRRLNDGQVTHLFFQQGAGHGRVDRNVILTTENFIVADDAKTQGLAVVVFDLHPGAEEDFTFLLRGVIDNFEILEALGQVTYPAIDLAQPLFIVLVVRILAAVAQACCPGDFFGHFRTLLAPQVVHLFFEFLVPFTGDQGRFHGAAFNAG